MRTSTLASSQASTPTKQRGRVCIVTGGAGFIGCALSSALVAKFGTVVAIDNLHPQIHATKRRPPALHAEVDLLIADVTDYSAWDRILVSCHPDVIIHLAAETGTGQSLTESQRHGQVNVCGTTTMLDALTRAGIAPARFVLASSRAVYGEGGWLNDAGQLVYPRIRSQALLTEGCWDFPGLIYTPCRAEVTWPRPCSVYGATKLAQEHVLGAWCAAHGSELSILRLQNVLGPGQSLNNSYTGIVPLFCRLARKGKAIPLYEDGAMLRDFVDIDDVAAALVLAATGAAVSAPLDIGTGRAVPIGDVARTVALRYRSPPPIVTRKYRVGDVRHSACDVGPTFRELPGWRPLRTLERSLERVVAWVETELEEVPA
jgi:dTDP-L-rhamnose 4-epimerase